jgi:hypothetical protein
VQGFIEKATNEARFANPGPAHKENFLSNFELNGRKWIHIRAKEGRRRAKSSLSANHGYTIHLKSAVFYRCIGTMRVSWQSKGREPDQEVG